MDMNSLGAYVAGRLKMGVGKEEIHGELLAVGWSEEESEAAYRAGLVASGVPVPSEGNRPTLSKKSSAVDVVINFFSFILLGIVATALGTLFFKVINRYFPDALDSTYWYAADSSTSAIHYSIAALLIGFPLYYFAMRLWFRKFREDEGRTESLLSKWLTYIVLLVTAVVIVGDLITVVFTLLQGEISVRFFLKALTILGIAGSIFGFYYLERRKIQYHQAISEMTFKYFGRGVTAVVLLGIVLGFMAGGSPATERQRTFDRDRAANLTTLAECIRMYSENIGALPSSLEDLSQSSQYSYCSSSMRDPETGAVYDYRIVTPSRVEGVAMVGEFELCANFGLAAMPSERDASQDLIHRDMGLWYEHGAGMSCDTATVQLVGKKPVDTLMPAPAPLAQPAVR